MTTVLGSASDVRRILGKSSDDLVDADAEAYLNESIRKIKSKYYTKYMLDLNYVGSIASSGATDRTFQTYFNMIPSGSYTSVYKNGLELTEDTDYTVDGTTSIITIADSVQLSEGDRVHIFYLPDFFDDMANYMAAARIMATSLVDIPNSAQAGAISSQIKETLKEYEDMIANKPHMAFFRDHKETTSIW